MWCRWPNCLCCCGWIIANGCCVLLYAGQMVSHPWMYYADRGVGTGMPLWYHWSAVDCGLLYTVCSQFICWLQSYCMQPIYLIIVLFVYMLVMFVCNSKFKCKQISKNINTSIHENVLIILFNSTKMWMKMKKMIWIQFGSTKAGEIRGKASNYLILDPKIRTNNSVGKQQLCIYTIGIVKI